MTLDFEGRLIDYLDELELGFTVYADATRTGDSISVVRMPGSRVINGYMDGAVDKQYNYFIEIKASEEKSRLKATNALQVISDNLIELHTLPSHNQSYHFNKIIIPNEPYHVARDDMGFTYFRMSLQAELYITRKGD